MIVKNWHSLYDLVYKKNLYNKASNVVSYLSTYLLKGYSKKVLLIFDLFY